MHLFIFIFSKVRITLYHYFCTTFYDEYRWVFLLHDVILSSRFGLWWQLYAWYSSEQYRSLLKRFTSDQEVLGSNPARDELFLHIPYSFNKIHNTGSKSEMCGVVYRKEGTCEVDNLGKDGGCQGQVKSYLFHLWLRVLSLESSFKVVHKCDYACLQVLTLIIFWWLMYWKSTFIAKNRQNIIIMIIKLKRHESFSYCFSVE